MPGFGFDFNFPFGRGVIQQDVMPGLCFYFQFFFLIGIVEPDLMTGAGRKGGVC
jgi:hypothetical protein